MAKYLAKFPQLTITIRNEVVQLLTGTNGITERHQNKPPFQVIFKPIASGAASGPAAENPIARLNPSALPVPDPEDTLHLESEYIRQGVEHWTKHRRDDFTPAALGAIPLTIPGGVGGRSTIAYRIESQFGFYDTDWIRDEGDRALAEAALDGENPDVEGFGVDWIRLVEPRKNAPWPSYDLLRAKGKLSVAMQVKKAIVDFGIDPRVVRAYELENLNRVEVLDAIEEAASGKVDPEEPEVIADDELAVEVK